MNRALYRTRQFFTALRADSQPDHLATAAELLTPGQLLLFRSLPASDQAHSLRVLRQLRRQGYDDPDLLAAALLHDVGKARRPLTVWERVLIVLVGALVPGLLSRWGRGEPRGWRRAFVVAEQHARWGAEMVTQVGGSARLAALIRHHQDEPKTVADRELSEALRVLRTADDWN